MGCIFAVVFAPFRLLLVAFLARVFSAILYLSPSLNPQTFAQVSADGPTRVLRISDQAEETSAPKGDDVLTMEARISVSSLGFTLLENVRPKRERDRTRLQVVQTVQEDSYSPLLYLRVIGVEVDYVSGEESVSAEVKLRVRADWAGQLVCRVNIISDLLLFQSSVIGLRSSFAGCLFEDSVWRGSR